MQVPILPVAIGLLLGVLLGCAPATPAATTAPVAPQERAPLAAPRAPQPGAKPAPEGPPEVGTLTERMIVYNANLTLRVKVILDTIEEITRIAQDVRGYVANANLRLEDEKPSAEIAVRVPASSYSEVLGRLRRLAEKVLEEKSSTQDVTEEYSDLESQLRNFRATESRYLELMQRAQTIAEILQVEERLTQTRNQIERLQGRMRFLERRAEMATITVRLVLPPKEPGEDQKGAVWDPLRVARKAWFSSLDFLRTLADVAITVTVFFWWFIIPLVFLVVIGLWWLRRHAARRQT